MSLGPSLRSFRAKNPHSKLVIFKFDVGATCRQMTMHFLYQHLTNITVNGERDVN
jgi:hypothetical protein